MNRFCCRPKRQVGSFAGQQIAQFGQNLLPIRLPRPRRLLAHPFLVLTVTAATDAAGSSWGEKPLPEECDYISRPRQFGRDTIADFRPCAPPRSERPPMDQWRPGRAAPISSMRANNKRKLQRLIKRKWHHRGPAPDIRSLGFVVGSLCCLQTAREVSAALLPYRATRSVLESSASRPIGSSRRV
jgi:hypothetical protein